MVVHANGGAPSSGQPRRLVGMGQAGGLQPQPVLQPSVPRIGVSLAIQTPFVGYPRW
jgi:hypothetical protein